MERIQKVRQHSQKPELPAFLKPDAEPSFAAFAVTAVTSCIVAGPNAKGSYPREVDKGVSVDHNGTAACKQQARVGLVVSTLSEFLVGPSL